MQSSITWEGSFRKEPSGLVWPLACLWGIVFIALIDVARLNLKCVAPFLGWDLGPYEKGEGELTVAPMHSFSLVLSVDVI